MHYHVGRMLIFYLVYVKPFLLRLRLRQTFSVQQVNTEQNVVSEARHRIKI